MKMLGIQGIPYLIVLDKDNRIVGTRLRGEQLDRVCDGGNTMNSSFVLYEMVYFNVNLT